MTTVTGDAPPDPDELESPAAETDDDPVDVVDVDLEAVEGDDVPPEEPLGGEVDRRPWITLAIVATATVFVVWNLRPWSWFLDSTPTGGDLGAHVWSPAYLRDVLLPAGRLTGWTPDWYAGFPAFTFYMVVPSLLVVIVNVGLDIPIGLIALVSAGLLGYGVADLLGFAPVRRYAAGFGAWLFALGLARLDGRALDLLVGGPFTYSHDAVETVLAVVVLPALVGIVAWRRLPAVWWRAAATVAAVVVTVLAVPVDYGVAMKLVVVAGLVTLPVAAWATGRLSGLDYPGPALLAVMTLPFIFDRSYNIYGGNLMSTMAGEFAYSLSLSLAVLYIGVLARGLETGRHRGLAAALLALTGLTHLFPAFFALVVTGAMLLVRAGSRSVRWLAVAGPLAALLAAFWVLPFYANRLFLNDMGWGKELRYVEALWSRGGGFGDQSFLVNQPVLQVFVVLAVIGAVLSGLRRVRLGMALAITATAFAVAFVLLPAGRLWNVRLLPFYYLSIYLLAGIALSELTRLLLRDRRARAGRPVVGWRRGVPAIAVGLVVMTSLAIPLRALPFGSTSASGEYGWAFADDVLPRDGVLTSAELNLGPYWLSYNFRGYEDKAATEAGGGTAEYTDMVATMARVGEVHGCGRALWEYESGRIGSYGTTMAPMLLPHWTDGCVGSMEGLYFEASATTPYHFLLQSELSASPSRAMRDLDYSGLDVAAGVEHLQTLGVRYYMAFSETAVAQARARPELTEIATSGPWVVFLVADSDLVVGLDHLPVVMDGTDVEEGGAIVDAATSLLCRVVPGWDCPTHPEAEDWLVASVASFEAGDLAPLVAADGPEEWSRVGSLESFVVETEGAEDVLGADPTRTTLTRFAGEQLPEWLGRTDIEPVAVRNIESDEFSISFTVDEVGKPVLVRTSYFPNWTVSGAEGPYRVAPNLMVVVPTDTDVELSYGRSGVELLSILLTVVGLVGLVVVARRPAVAAGPDAWDLAAAPADRRSGADLLGALRNGDLDAEELADRRRLTRRDRRAAATLAAVGAVLVVGSLVADVRVFDDSFLSMAETAWHDAVDGFGDLLDDDDAVGEDEADPAVPSEDRTAQLNRMLDERGERPGAALAVWVPGLLGLGLLVFAAGPRLLDTTRYLRRDLDPLAPIAVETGVAGTEAGETEAVEADAGEEAAGRDDLDRADGGPSTWGPPDPES